MAEPILEVTNLQTEFRTDRGTLTAVDGVSFSVDPGEVVGIVGESGSGKSALVRSLVRLNESDGSISADSVSWKGEEVLDMTAGRLRELRGGEISMIFQDPGMAMDGTYTVGFQIVEAIQAHRDLDDEAAWDEAVRLLEDVDIPNPEENARRYPYEYSGGMLQRAMIAIALANKPDLLIADEPTTGLDVTIQAKIIDLFRHLQDEYDMSILLITHNLSAASEICDDVLVMYAGEIVERGTRDAVLDDPRHPYTKSLLASIPRIDAPDSLESIGGEPPSLVAPPSGCRFHPRCPDAKSLCSEEPVPRVEFEGGHDSLCYSHTEAYEE